MMSFRKKCLNKISRNICIRQSCLQIIEITEEKKRSSQKYAIMKCKIRVTVVFCKRLTVVNRTDARFVLVKHRAHEKMNPKINSYWFWQSCLQITSVFHFFLSLILLQMLFPSSIWKTHKRFVFVYSYSLKCLFRFVCVHSVFFFFLKISKTNNTHITSNHICVMQFITLIHVSLCCQKWSEWKTMCK